MKMSELKRGQRFRITADADGTVFRYSGSSEPGDPSRGCFRPDDMPEDAPGVVTSTRSYYLIPGSDKNDPEVFPA